MGGGASLLEVVEEYEGLKNEGHPSDLLAEHLQLFLGEIDLTPEQYSECIKLYEDLKTKGIEEDKLMDNLKDYISTFTNDSLSNNNNNNEEIDNGKIKPKIIITGAPASGKGTQCEFIKSFYEVIHLSTGDMLRAAVKANTPLGKEAQEFMDAGKLVPDDTMIGIILSRLQMEDCQKKGWLLDGFPRSATQAIALLDSGIEPQIFINIEVPNEILIERVVGRRSDPDTGKIYHLTFSPPDPDDKELIDRLQQRSDDTEEKVKVRIQGYEDNLNEIIEVYKDKLIVFDGNRKPDIIFQDIKVAISNSLLKEEQLNSNNEDSHIDEDL
jgi:adenylate kinase